MFFGIYFGIIFRIIYFYVIVVKVFIFVVCIEIYVWNFMFFIKFIFKKVGFVEGERIYVRKSIYIQFIIIEDEGEEEEEDEDDQEREWEQCGVGGI